MPFIEPDKLGKTRPRKRNCGEGRMADLPGQGFPLTMEKEEEREQNVRVWGQRTQLARTGGRRV